MVAVVFGVFFGSIAALNRGKWLDNVIIFLSTCGIAIPSFVVSTLLLYFFGVRLEILPTFGLNTTSSYIMPVVALLLPHVLYIPANALLYAGRFRPGLHAYSQGQRFVANKISL